jgi:histidyl-tRNA synthetase
MKPYIGDYVIKIGSRKILNEIFNYLNLDSKVCQSVLIVIDKKAKVSPDDFKVMLEELLEKNKVKQLIQMIEGDYKKLLNLSNGLDVVVKEQIQMEDMLKQTVGLDNIVFDLSIIRGLGYYTGIVFEIFLKDGEIKDAVGGGGRYDKLADKFSSRNFVGVGGAVGFSRLIVPMLESGKIPLQEKFVDAVVISMDENCNLYAQQIGNKLREEKFKTVIDIDSSKFKKKMEYANKLNAGYVVIVGEDEMKSETVTLKNMETGENTKIKLEEAIKKIRS